MAEDVWNDQVAESYDATTAAMFDPEVVDATVSFLSDIARNGGALEFGIGTGRIALPLSQRGIRVCGIDLSRAMVQQLRKKPGADAIAVTVGDFATTRVESTFRLVYLVYNAITNLTTQDEQVECFRNAADHLVPGGFLVGEVFIPQLRRLPPGEPFQPFDVTPGHVGIREYDIASQRLVSHHYWFADRRRRVFSTSHRYVWPAELDLMAQLAGMSLRERWADWQRMPFTNESEDHVSVWQKVT